MVSLKSQSLNVESVLQVATSLWVGWQATWVSSESCPTRDCNNAPLSTLYRLACLQNDNGQLVIWIYTANTALCKYMEIRMQRRIEHAKRVSKVAQNWHLSLKDWFLGRDMTWQQLQNANFGGYIFARVTAYAMWYYIRLIFLPIFKQHQLICRIHEFSK